MHMRAERSRCVIRSILAAAALAALSSLGVGCDDAGPSPAVITPENVEELALSTTDTVTRAAVSRAVSSGLFDLGAMSAMGPDTADRVYSGDSYWGDSAPHLDMTRATPTSLWMGGGASSMRPIPYLREDDPERSVIYRRDLRPIVVDEETAAPGSSNDPFGLCDGGGAVLDGSTLRFSSCDVDGLCIFDGTARIDVSRDGNRFTVRFTGLDVSCDDYQPIRLDGDRLSCSGVQIGPLSCSYDMRRFTGALTGVQFRVESMDVGGDIESSFTISATIVDPDHGRLSLETLEPVAFEVCPWEVPTDGVVAFEGVPGTFGTVDFMGCDEAEICLHTVDVLEPDCDTLGWSSLFGIP